jgi:Flp pilus assembly protein TadG
MITTGNNRRGAVLIYAMLTMIAFIAMCSLAVDWGRVQFHKTELQTATDAAARAGADGLATNGAAAIAAAKSIALKNTANGTAVTLQTSDIELGVWDSRALTFTLNSTSPNAVRVTARRTVARGNAIPLSFASLIGRSQQDITTQAIAMRVPPVAVNMDVQATANPFLSGMPAGTKSSLNNPHNNPDTAGAPGSIASLKQSPTSVAMPITEGAALTFDSIGGTAKHDPSLDSYEPDGTLSESGHNNPTPNDSNSYGMTYYNEHGIADVRAPINALVGIFLSDDQPDKTAAPANLDFSTTASRNFETLQPQLKQIFFIGDGLNDVGVTQKFVAPPGATRLFLATWDFYEWNNNSGLRTVKITRPDQIIMVK